MVFFGILLNYDFHVLCKNYEIINCVMNIKFFATKKIWKKKSNKSIIKHFSYIVINTVARM